MHSAIRISSFAQVVRIQLLCLFFNKAAFVRKELRAEEAAWLVPPRQSESSSRPPRRSSNSPSIFLNTSHA